MGHRLCVRNAVPMMPRMAMDAPINIEIEQGCTLCVIGRNGAGKSILTSILTGDCPIREGGVTIDGSSVTHGDIITLSFRDIYSAAQLRDMYYQQRFNSFNSDEAPTVAEVLEEYAGALYGRMADVCGIEDMLDKRTIALSSGQTRKLHIYRAVIKKPKYIVIENLSKGNGCTSCRIFNFRSRDTFI